MLQLIRAVILFGEVVVVAVGMMVVAVVWLMSFALAKTLRSASHRPAFMGNCPTISHTFLVLSTQWMSSP